MPLKDVIRSIPYNAENTTKATYELVSNVRETKSTLEANKESLQGQCTLMKVLAENQQELAMVMKSSSGQGCNAPEAIPGGFPPPMPNGAAPPSGPTSVGHGSCPAG